MSRRSYSRHIPDFRLITFIAESGRSVVHRMNPWTKAALLIVVVMLVIVLTDLYLIALLFGLTLAFYAAGRLSLRLLIGWYSLPLLFVGTLAIMFIFTEPGTPLGSIDFFGLKISVTDKGVLLLVRLLLRALAVVTFSLAFFMTTKYVHVAFMASKLLPQTLADIFLLSYRFTYETSDEVSDVMDAMHARNGGLVKGLSRQTKTFAGIFGISFVHAFERAERISKAMEARGFSGKFPLVERIPRPSPSGYALVVLGVLAVSLVTFQRYVGHLPGW